MSMRAFDPGGLEPRAVYRLLTQLVVPRPIAWVSSLAPDGRRNLAPHSYFNIISTGPPVLHFTSAGHKDTLRNVRATGEFVVNVVTRDLVEAMNLTSGNFPPEEDEFAWAGLEAAASALVAPPRVAAARAALECRLRQELTIGNGTMLFGDVVAVHVAEELLDGDDVVPERLAAVGRLGGSAYAAVDEVFRIDRPTWEALRAHGAPAGGKV